MEWQPFSTAPKDGAAILTFGYGGDKMVVMAWLSYHDSSYPFAWQDPLTGSCFIREWKDDEPPTHWMPLPEKPKPKPKYEVSIFKDERGCDAILHCNCTQMGEIMFLKAQTFDLLLTAITDALTKHESE